MNMFRQIFSCTVPGTGQSQTENAVQGLKEKLARASAAISTRPAFPQDIPRLAEITNEAYFHSESGEYFFIRVWAKRYPEKAIASFRNQIIKYLEDLKRYIVMVAVVKRTEKLVGFAVWDLRPYDTSLSQSRSNTPTPGNHNKSGSSNDPYDQDDICVPRYSYYQKRHQNRKLEFISSTSSKLELKELVVHPKHWEKGYGTRLIMDGTDAANAKERGYNLWPIIAVGLPGEVCEKIGFKKIGQIEFRDFRENEGCTNCVTRGKPGDGSSTYIHARSLRAHAKVEEFVLDVHLLEERDFVSV